MGLLDGCMGGVPGVLDFETVGKPGRDLGKLSWQIGQIGEYWPILVPIPGKLINIPTPTRAPTRVAVAV